MKGLTAYIDESGNSRVKIFSGNDKFHWVGVMMTSQETVIDPEEVKKIANKVGFDELHGGELGLSRINKISDDLIKVYEQLDANFIFTRVEKEQIATIKFVDLVF